MKPRSKPCGLVSTLTCCLFSLLSCTESGDATNTDDASSTPTNTAPTPNDTAGGPSTVPEPSPTPDPGGPGSDGPDNPQPVSPIDPQGGSGGQATMPTAGVGGSGGSPNAGGSGGNSDNGGLGGNNSNGGNAGQGAADVCATALFCDDFEDDTLNQAPGNPWQTAPNGATVTISSERAFSGSQSVFVSTTSGAYKQGYFSLEGDPVFPGAASEMYGRMMMWLENTPAGSVHWTFIQAEGPSDDDSYTALYRYGGQHEGRLMANFETQGLATDCWDHSNTVMPTQTWVCLEWRFNVATDEMQLWLDGEALEDIHVVGQGEGCVAQDLGGQWPAPRAFETLRLGWERYQESDERNVWIDDVVVSNEPIGCP